FPKGDVIYVSSHAHYCGNLPDGFNQTNPWTMHYGTAFTKAALGTLKVDPLGYPNWVGNPSPYLLKFLPLFTQGSYTGQGQATWHVTGNDSYVVYGGEFPTTNGVAQQGLVRFAVREIAPNLVGPVFSQSKINPRVNSFVPGTVRIAWQANWDRDNENLTYKVIRDGITASPIYTVNQLSSEWNRPIMSYTDTGLVPGQQYRYRIFVSDPYGNEARSDTVFVTVSTDGTMSTYAQGVLNDGAGSYWRLGENPATPVIDWAGFSNATAGSGVTGPQTGAIIGDTDPASAFNGTTTGFASTTVEQPAPDTFTAEAWFKTTSTAGGRILGFGTAKTGNSSRTDRHVYLDSNGRVTFGVSPGVARTITSAKTYRDGQWHHVVASLGSSGMALYVDGAKVGSRTDTTFGLSYTGYWRIGGDSLSGWPSQPASNYLNGQIDDAAIYPRVLTPTQIRQHYVNSGRTLAGPPPPTDAYGAAVYGSEPDLYWRLAETSGTTVNDAGPNQLLGTYSGTRTLGQPSGIGLVGDTSVLFNGTSPLNGTAATQVQFTNPTVYAEELWFRTSTTAGGKLIGFSGSATGLSTSYDRHVYMFNDGRLSFGAYTGVQNVVNSTKSYNDNKWHYLLAQQDSSGMKLYVDSELVGSNAVSGSQNFTGYWRIGGDATWGGNSSNYFQGNLDEVAVYSRTLGDAERLDHFVKGGGDVPNVNPTAAFTFTVNKLTVNFDSSGSADPDGTIAAYLWDFGDGQSSTQASPAHTFAGAGPQTVKLTVTDNKGATGSVTKTVTTVANQAPVADFTAAVNKQDVTFDSSSSSDADGTVVSYLWDFGDGSPASTQANPSHHFDAVTTYNVTLTVTDDNGATGVATKPVTTVTNASPTAVFSSTVSNLTVSFDASGSSDSDGTVASYSWDFGDGQNGTGVSPNHTYAAAGTFDVVLTVTDNDGATDSVTHSVTTVAPTGPIAQDAFERTVTNGWGNADTGGAWTRYGTASLFSVGSGTGQIRLAAAGAGPRIALDSVSSASTEGFVKVALDKIPDGGGGFVSLGVRTIGTTDYRAKVKVAATGVLTLYLVKVINGTETTLTSTSLGTAFSYTLGSTLQIKAQATGVSPTTVRAKVWKTTQTEPSTWQLTTTDISAGLQTAGGVGLVTFLSGTSTNTPIVVSFDDLLVTVP
ncbi:MAG TPA: PKD domain-containing protein, partial [Propionicimonas sp.]